MPACAPRSGGWSGRAACGVAQRSAGRSSAAACHLSHSRSGNSWTRGSCAQLCVRPVGLVPPQLVILPTATGHSLGQHCERKRRDARRRSRALPRGCLAPLHRQQHAVPHQAQHHAVRLGVHALAVRGRCCGRRCATPRSSARAQVGRGVPHTRAQITGTDTHRPTNTSRHARTARTRTHTYTHAHTHTHTHVTPPAAKAPRLYAQPQSSSATPHTALPHPPSRHARNRCPRPAAPASPLAAAPAAASRWGPYGSSSASGCAASARMKGSGSTRPPS
jgi:hypothetical protein